MNNAPITNETQYLQAKADYEQDCKDFPRYHDGKERPKFEELRPWAQRTWIELNK